MKNCLCILLLLVCCSHLVRGQQKPNVFFLYSDDQRSGTLNLGGKGNPDVLTPTLDKLADNGAYFPNTYVFGGDRGSVCTPSRAQLLSGKCLFRTNTIDLPSVGPKNFNLPVALRLNGYLTMRSGKANNVPYGINSEFDVNVERANRGSVAGNLGYWQDAADFVNGKTIKGLGGSSATWNGRQPFFLYLAVGTPHGPYPADQTAIDAYEGATVSAPVDVLKPHPILSKLPDAKPSKPTTTKADVQAVLKEYYASISFMDRKLGEFIQLLQKKGLYENTIIVVAGDNGLSIGSHGLEGKSNLFEFGGLHVPMLMHGPGIQQGYFESLASLLDIFPTLCDLTGSPKPETLDGLSLIPILSGQATKVRDQLLTVFTKPEQRALREARWKLWYFPDQDVYELYDLQNDPRELNNIAGRREVQTELKRLQELMVAERIRFGDTYPKQAKLSRPFDKKNPAPHMVTIPFDLTPRRGR